MIGYPAPSCPALPFEWPEVWVQDEDFQHAGEIVSQCQNEESQPNVLRSFRRERRARVASVQLKGPRKDGNASAARASRGNHELLYGLTPG